MKRVLITGANSYVGTNVESWLNKFPDMFEVETIGTFNGEWKKADFAKFDSVFHVAGIAHVDAKKKMEPLYRKINTELTIEIAKWAKENNVKHFIFMSSTIVYKESKSLKKTYIDENTIPTPNGFYGDSKLQAEFGLHNLEDENFKVSIVRPPMIYGPHCKGNFLRLAKLGTITPIFPAFHNQRSMLYIDNLCEFIRQVIKNELTGVLFPQNSSYSDTVQIVKYFAEKYNHKLFVWKWLNIFVYAGSIFFNSLNKMFSDYIIDSKLSVYNFNYQIVDFEDSLKNIELNNASIKRLK